MLGSYAVTTYIPVKFPSDSSIPVSLTIPAAYQTGSKILVFSEFYVCHYGIFKRSVYRG